LQVASWSQQKIPKRQKNLKKCQRPTKFCLNPQKRQTMISSLWCLQTRRRLRPEATATQGKGHLVTRIDRTETGQQQQPFGSAQGGQNHLKAWILVGQWTRLKFLNNFLAVVFQVANDEPGDRVYSLAITFMEPSKGWKKLSILAAINEELKFQPEWMTACECDSGTLTLLFSVRADPISSGWAGHSCRGRCVFSRCSSRHHYYVSTIDERLNLSAGRNSAGYINRLRGKGVKSPQSNRVGDQYVKV